jgi:hypothetical protein
MLSSKQPRPATAANLDVIQKMVACSFCKVRLPVGDAIKTQQRFYRCVDHQKSLITMGCLEIATGFYPRTMTSGQMACQLIQ